MKQLSKINNQYPRFNVYLLDQFNGLSEPKLSEFKLYPDGMIRNSEEISWTNLNGIVTGWIVDLTGFTIAYGQVTKLELVEYDDIVSLDGGELKIKLQSNLDDMPKPIKNKILEARERLSISYEPGTGKK